MRAVYLLDRYFDAIEFDLAGQVGKDLEDFYGDEPRYTVGKLMRFVFEFEAQSSSKLAEAIANDDEMFDEYIEKFGLPKSSGDRRIRLSEYTPTLAALSDMHEMMQSNVHGVFKKKGKPKISKMPRPITSMGRYKKRRRQRNIEHIESMLVFSDELYNQLPEDSIIPEKRYQAIDEEKPRRGLRKPPGN